MAEHQQMMTKEIARQQLQQWRALSQIRPEDSDLMQNVASCMFTLGMTEEALALYPQAYAMNHASPAVAMNYGMILKDLGKYAESADLVHHAYLLDTDYFYLKLGWAESLLRNGSWRDAWPLYQEARPVTKQGARNQIGLPDEVIEWKGEPLTAPDNKLLVLGEGGTGDRINYARWLPELDKLGIDWIFFVDNNPPIPGLSSLFDRVAWLKGKTRKMGDVYEVSHWTTGFCLPACFDAIPTKIPRYPSPFVPDPELVQKFKITKPEGDNRPVYGLIWGANELFEGGMKFRSLMESQAMRIVMSTCDLCHWVNCWNGDAAGTNSKLGLPAVNPRFEGWEETAALIANMDGIVTTDNGAAWLAMALGKPCSILLSSNSDWKFLTKTTKCYWHDKARLFRNNGPNGPEQGFERSVDACITSIRNGEGVGR